MKFSIFNFHFLILFLTILLLFFSLIPGLTAHAALVPCGGSGGQRPCTIQDISTLIQNIINFILWQVVPYVAVLMLVIGGIVFLFAGGSPQLKTWGKNIIFTAIIGMAIAFLAWGIVTTILKALGYTHPLPPPP